MEEQKVDDTLLQAKHDEFTGTVCGAAAMGSVAALTALDAIDMLRERCPRLFAGKVKTYCHAIAGKNGEGGMVGKLFRNISMIWEDARASDWVQDFSSAVNNEIQESMTRLQAVVANRLAKHHGIADPNTCAAFIIAQSFALETKKFIERRKNVLRGCRTVTRAGEWHVPMLLDGISCAGIEFRLRLICEILVAPFVPDNFDILADRAVHGCVTAVYNALCDPGMWRAARLKADELSGWDSVKGEFVGTRRKKDYTQESQKK